MSYNIQDFWLRFDEEPGSVTDDSVELNLDDLQKLVAIAFVIKTRNPDGIGIFERASHAELLFVNGRFLTGQCKRRSFQLHDSRTFGIPFGLMVKKSLYQISESC